MSTEDTASIAEQTIRQFFAECTVTKLRALLETLEHMERETDFPACNDARSAS